MKNEVKGATGTRRHFSRNGGGRRGERLLIQRETTVECQNIKKGREVVELKGESRIDRKVPEKNIGNERHVDTKLDGRENAVI